MWRIVITLCCCSFITATWLIQDSILPDTVARSSLAQPQDLDQSSGRSLVVHKESTAAPNRLFFPLVFAQDPFLDDLPIWNHSRTPANHEVAFFRRHFHLTNQMVNAELAIYADTRYQVWLDGAFIGNGPARSSRTLREYDQYPLGILQPGDHNLSVLVQWAPNHRRSESIAPYLKGHIQGSVSGRFRIAAQTGPEWLSVLSDAWRQDSVLVHSWGLIGPTELLDLRQLPADWQTPQYDDSTWTPAVIQTQANDADALYRPRSIPFLVNVPISAIVHDGGLLSPGFEIGEIQGTDQVTYSIDLTNTEVTSPTLETLFSSLPVDDTVFIDGAALNWQAAANRRDVYTANQPIQPGAHQLLFTQIPSQGLAFAVSKDLIEPANLPFQQGINPGRRLLLANLVSEPEIIQISIDPVLQLSFPPAPAYAVLDLGRTVHGKFSAQVSGPAGTVVDIGWDERLDGVSQRPLPYPGSLHPEWSQADSWILDGATRNISTIDNRSGRYILIGVWGNAPVTITNLKVSEERYPLVQTGDFDSSDPLLNQIWQIGVDTLYPNMTDAYTDTPWRERGQWWGDAFIEDQINALVFGDSLLLKRGITYMSTVIKQTESPGLAPNSNGTHMLDFSMLWVQSIAAYLQRSGDSQYIDTLYPSLHRFIQHLRTFENTETGLLDLPQMHWSRTAYVDSLGYHSRYGQSTAINALYYATLEQAADLAEIYGDLASAQAWRNTADNVKQAINTVLYLPAEKRYITNLYQGVAYPPTPHAQAWALVYNLVPPEQIDGVASSLLELLSTNPSSPNVSIYGMYWVINGLGQAGKISQALDIIKNYYGYLINSGATTWWESFDADLSYKNSLSHGWGGSPTWFLSAYLLGFEQSGPDTWRINPNVSQQTGLNFISETIPLLAGPLRIAWNQPDCHATVIDLDAPQGTQGEIIVPIPDPGTTIELNGEFIWRNGLSTSDLLSIYPDGAHILLNGGSHTISWQQTCQD